MRILVLSIPRPGVQLARRAEPALRGRPVGVAEGPGAERLLTAVSAEASAAGAAAGMTVEEGLARCPGMAVRALTIAAELAELERMSAVLQRKATPCVAIIARDALAVDLAGLEGRFADEAGAAAGLLGLARQWSGLDVRAAVADTVEEALAAARLARRGPIVCEPRGERGRLPAMGPLRARVAGPDALERALERLGQLLTLAGLSAREATVAVHGEAGERRYVLRSREPLHGPAELAELARPLRGAARGAASVEVELGGLGPSFAVAPLRRSAGRRLALAS